jgi:AI-2 transport protein TqsA
MPDTQQRPTAESFLSGTSRWIIILAGLLFLLKELGTILKPLFLAILLGYIIIPLHIAVRRRIHGRFSLFVLAGLSTLLILGITYFMQSNIASFRDSWPELEKSANTLRDQVLASSEERMPWLSNLLTSLSKAEQEGEGMVKEYSNKILSVAAGALSTGVVVGLYLMFLLLEAGRFPARVSKAFSSASSEPIQQTIREINQGIAQYLAAKFYASLLLAVPIFVVLVVFQTRFALFWALLVFLCNFIPYLGSVVGYALPAGFALLQFGFGWESATIATVMLVIHIVTSSVVEPKVIGKAVGVSPVIILLALAFWGSIWGLTGMLLAVPLTVMMKITLEHIDTTRPLARLISDD